MLRFDAFTIQKEPYRTPEGYLVVAGRVAKAGVLDYVNLDGSTRRELVPWEELSRADSLETIALKPVTDLHPAMGQVTAENARDLQRGFSLQKVRATNPYVEIELLITDEELAKKIERGDARELSLGYTLQDLDETPGEHPEYGRYDAIQRGRMANHVAVVPRGRAGSDVRLRMDSKVAPRDVAFYTDTTEEDMTVEDKKGPDQLVHSIDALKGKIEDLAVSLAERRADEEETEGPLQAVIEAMKEFTEYADSIKSQADELNAKHDEMKGQLEALYADLASKKEDEVEEEKKEGRADGLTEADMLAWHKERKALEAAASGYRIDSVDDLDNASLRKAIVAAHFGKERVDGASDAEIIGYFKALQAIRADRDDSYQSAGVAVKAARTDSASDGQSAYTNRLRNAWRGDSESERTLLEKLAAALKE